MRYSVALIAFLLFLAACGNHSSPEPTKAASTAPVAVQTIAVQTETWPMNYEAPGTVRARTSAPVSSRVMGYIGEIRVRPGDRVQAGQLLATIDARDMDVALRQSRAAELEAQSAVLEADNGIAAAAAQLALARATFTRMKTLHDQTSISNQEFDQAQATLRGAEASMQMAQSKRKQLEARIEQAKQMVESASIARSHTQLVAPFAGVVIERTADPGQLATPGMPLLTIEGNGSYRLEANVEESMLRNLRVGQRAKVVVEAYGRTVEARIDEIVPAVDPQSRAFLVKAALPPDPSFRSGLFGRLLIGGGTRSSIVAPAGAITRRGELEFALVAENGAARTRMLTVGERREGFVEIRSGLVPGERIIHPRPSGLTDGARVEAR